MKGAIRRYSELKAMETYSERFRYLSLGGAVGEDTFGFDRYLNQRFYRSAEWRRVRDIVISRDNGCDLGISGREITGRILIHHMNPVTITDIQEGSGLLLDPEYLICVTQETHNAIHYGDDRILKENVLEERAPGDTAPWKKNVRR